MLVSSLRTVNTPSSIEQVFWAQYIDVYGRSLISVNAVVVLLYFVEIVLRCDSFAI